jgi:hypothetical protein
MRTANVVAFALACICLIGIQACDRQEKITTSGDFVEWYLANQGNFSYNYDPNFLLRIAEFEADVSAKGPYLQTLGKARHTDPRSRAAVFLAGFLHDNDSARLLEEVFREADDQLRGEASLALFRRHKYIDLDTALVVLEHSSDGMVRSCAVQLAATADEDPRGGVDHRVDQLYSKALADPCVGVRATLFRRLPHRASARRMVKEWLQKQLEFSPEAKRFSEGDIDTALLYLIDSYGLRSFDNWMPGDTSAQMARKVLALAEQIDSFTDNFDGKNLEGH